MYLYAPLQDLHFPFSRGSQGKRWKRGRRYRNEEEGDVILSTYMVVVAQDVGHTLVVYEDLLM